jgi:hypothetical protein
MSRLFLLGLFLFSAPADSQAQDTRSRGQVVFSADFEGEEPLKGWTGEGKLERGYEGGQALAIARQAGPGEGSAMAVIELPVRAMRGYRVHFSARVKARDVSPKPRPWNGVKFMAPIETASGRSWPQAELGTGTFDWQRASFSVRVPDDAQHVWLYLGLEAVNGKAWFDDVRVSLGKALPRRMPGMANGPVFTGHDPPRLRGTMVSPSIDEAGLRTLGRQWNANLIRWQLVRPGPVSDPLDLAAYDRWLRSALARLDAALPACERYGLMVVVDLHSPPGGRIVEGAGYAGSDFGLFTDPACQARFVELWRQFARRYQGQKAIWGFDLANEPVETALDDRLADWQELAERAARAVRAVDPARTIIVEPPEWGGPDGFREFGPLSVPRVVYSVHMYVPHTFTHQGVHGPSRPQLYPGRIEGKLWDKGQLEAALQPVVDFQRAYGVQIYVGEFSAIRWAPQGSACRYLKDLIDIFEAHGWDWSYHAFREWDGWSVEHGANPQQHQPESQPTDRQRLLGRWFSENAKPRNGELGAGGG